MPLINCEFFLIRYVPDVVKGEFTNIGVLLREQGREDSAVVRFTHDWSRVRCMDSEVDVALLESLEADIAERLRLREPKPVLQVLEDSLSNSLQISAASACLAESIPAELAQLMQLYVEPIKVQAERRKASGRAAIAASMRSAFERAGVWGLLNKRIAASTYTQPGDPLKIDCGYRPNGVIRMFHAVSLDGDIETAKGLAYSAEALRSGVERVENAKLDLTAIVETPQEIEADGSDRYRFGVETMENSSITVISVSDLARIAETARVELRA